MGIEESYKEMMGEAKKQYLLLGSEDKYIGNPEWIPRCEICHSEYIRQMGDALLCLCCQTSFDIEEFVIRYRNLHVGTDRWYGHNYFGCPKCCFW